MAIKYSPAENLSLEVISEIIVMESSTGKTQPSGGKMKGKDKLKQNYFPKEKPLIVNLLKRIGNFIILALYVMNIII